MYLFILFYVNFSIVFHIICRCVSKGSFKEVIMLNFKCICIFRWNIGESHGLQFILGVFYAITLLRIGEQF